MNIPSSTYRIQFHKDFNFHNLQHIVDYLHTLGISTVYASPVFSATPGSMHGYDVTDPHSINPEIGTLQELRALSVMLKEKNMLWLQDIVPNHMAFNTHNYRLMDVLERGPHSTWYHYFDINWSHPDPELNGKVMAPFLGKELNECLEAGEIKLTISKNGFSIDYFDTQYPLSITAYEQLLHLLPMEKTLQKHIEELIDRAYINPDHAAWSSYKKAWMEQVHKQYSTQQLQELTDGVNNNHIILKELLLHQHYLLTYWKRSEQEINYRRFFTINGLICLRMEDKAVFDEYHAFIHTLYRENIIQGLRIDHIDGLHDPNIYIKSLRKLFGNECYVIAEKILEANESIPAFWDIHGASGYQFLSQVSQLFTNRQGARQLLRFYYQLVPDVPIYKQLVYENKKMILENYMGGEWENLVEYFFTLELQQEHDRATIKEALALVMLSLPVYRIYPRQIPVRGANLTFMQETFNRARIKGQKHGEALTFLESLFLGIPKDQEHHDRILRFLNRMMQFTGPLTAKGVEDTTFYIYNPLISHVEVGDAPSTLGITVQEFHKRMDIRRKHVPFSLNATATHDTKRGEDARMRLNVLSKIPAEWEEQVRTWLLLNEAFHKKVNGHRAPTLNDEYFIYQSVIGGFPEDLQVTDEWINRLKEYMTKVTREAKVNSNWETPDDPYETACHNFISNILAPGSGFLTHAMPFIKQVIDAGNFYSLGQTLIKLTAPGIPDTYQGCELWDLSFVDPDNRRPVDYTIRMNYLKEIMSREAKGRESLFTFLREHRQQGLEKLFITWKTLSFRRTNNAIFTQGDYIPLEITGPETRVIAYARMYEDTWAMVIVPLNITHIDHEPRHWKEYQLILPDYAPQHWGNLFTGEQLEIAGKVTLYEILTAFPVGLLHGLQ